MADRKISDLTALTTPAAGDYLPIVDISEAAAASKNKRITVEELMRGAPDGTAGAPGFAFESDPNSGIYSPGADQVAISTGGSGRLFVGPTGQIGISQSSLATGGFTGGTLRIGHSTGQTAGVLLQNTSTAADSSFWYTDGTGSYLGSNNGFFAHFAGGAERLRITSAGLVGIGTSTIRGTSLLDARGDISFGSNASYYGLLSYNAGTGHFESTSSDGGFKWIRASGSATSMTLDSSGRLGIGTTSPGAALQVNGVAQFGATGQDGTIQLLRSSDGGAVASLGFISGTTEVKLNNALSGPTTFYTNNTERARIDSSGRLLVGTSTSRDKLFSASGEDSGIQLEGLSGKASAISTVRNTNDNGGCRVILGKTRSTSVGGYGLVSSGDQLGLISFQGGDGTNLAEAARIECFVDAASGANDMPGRLVFSTTADGASSPTERMRITSGGEIQFGNTTNGAYTVTRNPGICAYFDRRTSDGVVISFERQGSGVGNISVTTTATAYNTSSDYRLKENVTPVTDGITRLQQLKPSRFNFIADPDTVVDGFIAHEVQSVVPEAITGEKDAVDDDGNPIYQGIDQSKLVPLLTAALQEALIKIESLEAKVAALETP